MKVIIYPNQSGNVVTDKGNEFISESELKEILKKHGLSMMTFKSDSRFQIEDKVFVLFANKETVVNVNKTIKKLTNDIEDKIQKIENRFKKIEVFLKKK